MPPSERDLRRLAELLGREPRGLEEVAVRDSDGEPLVIRVAPLVDDKPFPTLFWLVGRRLCYRLDRAEAGGLIRRLQQRIDVDPALQCAMEADHRAYIALRQGYMTAEQHRRLCELGYDGVLQRKGIGGIADFTRIRCLHTWYAAHLVTANTVGRLVDEYWAAQAR